MIGKERYVKGGYYMLSKAELNAIKERAEKATPCLWFFNGSEIVSEHLPNTGIAGAITDEDCEFIAHAREDIPKLVAEVEHLQELKKLYEEILEWYAHPETYKRAGNGEYVIMTDKGWNAKWALNKRLKGYSD